MTSEKTTPKIQHLPGPVIGALADAFGKSFLTIQRWVKNKDIILTTDIAQRVFKEWNIEWNPNEENQG